MVNALDTVMCTLTLPTTVAVVDEQFFEDGRNLIVDIMMDNPVLEVGGKNLPLYRSVDNEADAGAGRIVPIKYVIHKMEQLLFKAPLKGQSIKGVALVFSGVKIGLKQVFQDLIGIMLREQG